MPTTSLIVEVVVIGSVTLSSIVLLATGILDPVTARHLTGIQEPIKDLSVAFAVPLLAITYSVGWIVNFISERLFKTVFQERLRGSVFPKGSSYELARITVLQRGSSELVHEVLLDRHIIRLSRAGVINFFIFGIGFVAYGLRGWSHAYLAAIFSACLAILSFLQWRTRYAAHYERIRKIADVLRAEPERNASK